MRIPTFRLPHIPRLFSAAVLFLILWGGLGILFSINTLNIQSKLSPKEDVLGITATESARLTDQFTYWKTIIEKTPDYRDAYIMAAAMAYQLENKKEAQNLIDQALQIDPSHETALQMKKLLEE